MLNTFTRGDWKSRLLCALTGIVCAVLAFSLFMPNPELVSARARPDHAIVLDRSADCEEGECGELRCEGDCGENSCCSTETSMGCITCD